MAASKDRGDERREDFVGGVLNMPVQSEDDSFTLESFQELLRQFFESRPERQAIILPEGAEIRSITHPAEVRQETSTNNPKEYSERLKRKAETMYKYKFRFKGGGKRVDNMNFKFHCFVADSDAVEHHLFAAKEKGLVVQKPAMEGLVGEDFMYDSAMPVVKIFTSTSGFGIPKEYFSFFFLLNPESKKMVKIRPLGFDKSIHISEWYFLGAGRFLKKEEIRKFFGHKSDTWKFYQRQSFISKRRLLEIVEVGDNKDVYTGEVHKDKEQIRTIRID